MRVRDRQPHLFFHKGRQQWIIVYWHPRRGRRAWKHTQTADPELAKQQLALQRKRLGAVDLGLLDLPPDGTPLTVDHCIDLVIAYYRRERRRALASTISQAKAARRAIGALRADTLTLALVNGARDTLTEWGYAPNTINRTLGIVRFGLTLAYQAERLPHVPKFAWPRYDDEEFIREIYVTAEELVLVNAHEPHQAVRDMTTWAFLTGMRWNEPRRAPWTCFDARTWTLRLPRRLSKGKKTRPLMITADSPELRAILERRLEARDPGCPYIFHVDGRIIGRYRWNHAWRRAGLPMVKTKLGNEVPAKQFRDMRRTGVRNLVLAGNSEKQAMMVSGHRTRSIFDRYNLTEEREIAVALGRTSAYVGPLPHLPPAPLSRWQEAHARRLLRERPPTRARSARTSAHAPRPHAAKSANTGPAAR